MSKRLFLSAICVAALAGGCGMKARAEDAPLFTIDNSKWSSYGQPATAAAVGAVPTAVLPATGAGPAAKPAGATMLAAPARPLNLPVMPGVNQSYLMSVKSTAEETAALPQKRPSAAPDQPVFQIEERNWQKADQIARQKAIADPSIDDRAPDGSDVVPLDVRLSFLPNRDVAPLEDEKTPTSHRPKDIAFVQAIKKAPKPPTAQAAAQAAECAAVDAYKQQQLEALQSDRRTLTDLQKAIFDLGLQQQLSFIAGGPSSGGVEAQNSQTGGAVKGHP